MGTTCDSDCINYTARMQYPIAYKRDISFSYNYVTMYWLDKIVFKAKLTQKEGGKCYI